MQLFMIAFASVWPVLFPPRPASKVSIRAFWRPDAYSISARIAQIFRIVLPSALPSIATGLRTASAIALVLAITVEDADRPCRESASISRMSGSTAWSPRCGQPSSSPASSAISSTPLFMIVERSALPWSPENRDR